MDPQPPNPNYQGPTMPNLASIPEGSGPRPARLPGTNAAGQGGVPNHPAPADYSPPATGFGGFSKSAAAASAQAQKARDSCSGHLG